jgi:putative methyltransferase (TIGR04325 family)
MDLFVEIKDYIPPIIPKIWHKLQKQEKYSLLQRVYPTYYDGLAACGGHGYELDDLVNVVYLKTKALTKKLNTEQYLSLTEVMSQSLTAVLLTAIVRENNSIKVIDLGGACGLHYSIAKIFLGDKIKLHWAVVETRKMAQKARALQTEELRFFESISDAHNEFGDIDLFHSSGAIQYVPDPEITIPEIMNSGAPVLFLSRLALLTGNKKYLVSVQESMLSANGPGPLPPGIKDRKCRYPISYIGKEWLESQISLKYRKVLNFGETVVGTIDRQSIISTGYLASSFNQ